ncbi:hypothetical protein V5799_030886 [Amblyomma americanum]|uniref:Uncharacterized protein n=1 Tax=Amblyomma americanum TaxID=6943 RepID=A0AAQ4EMG7_AMBAM
MLQQKASVSALLAQELAQVKEQLAQAQASPQPTTKVDPSSSPATNGPSAEKEDKGIGRATCAGEAE